MPMALRTAQALKPGDLLTFGTDDVYEVIDVTAGEKSLSLALKRVRDGYLTHAAQHDLDVAARVTPEPPASSPAPEQKPPAKRGAARPKRSAKP